MTVLKSLNCIFFFLIFLATTGFSQNYPTEPIDAYQPDSLFAVRNAIKIDPLQVVFGVYDLSYERIINAGYSVEFTAGITRRNYAAGWFGYSLDNLGQNVEIQTGYQFSIAVRKYILKSDELYGPYISVGIDTRDYRMSYSVIDSSGVLTGDVFEENRNYLSYMLNFGYQALPRESNIFADFYFGISLRHEDLEIVKTDNIYDSGSYYISPKDVYGLGVQIGVKIGVGF